MPYKDRGCWRGVVKIDGKRVAAKRFPRTVQGKRDARQWEAETREKWTKPSGVTVLSEIIAGYLDYSQARYQPKVYEEKVTVARRFLAFLGGEKATSKPAEEITTKVIEDYLLSQAKARSNNSANRDRKNLSAMFAWALRRGDVVANPVAVTEKYPHDRAVQYTPPPEDVDKVLLQAQGVDRVFLECYLQTGARRSEIFRMTWNDIDFGGRRIRLWTRKTADGSMEGEWLPMTERLHKHLSWWWKRRDKQTPYVFVVVQPGAYTGQPYKVRRRFLAGLCERAGVKRFGFHALRRYVGTFLARQGVPMEHIRRILRHKNLSTTERYISNWNRDLRGSLELLGGREAIERKKGYKKQSR